MHRALTGEFFLGGAANTDIYVTLDANGEATRNFRVGMQPGNNYRVAAVFAYDEGEFAELQVDDDEEPHYIPPSDAPADFGGGGAVSPMLTVWRKLHLEFDLMDERNPATVPNNVTGTVLGYAENSPSAGQSQLEVSESPALLDTSRFKDGTIVIDGQTYRVVDNIVYIGSPTYSYVIIDGTPGSGVVSESFVLRDDDDEFLAELDLPDPLADEPDGAAAIAALQPKFSPAYIKLVDAATLSLNPNTRVDFALNEEPGLFTNYDDAFDFDGVDEPAFWAWMVVLGYQPNTTNDGDPTYPEEGLKLGSTPAWNFTWIRWGWSAIYIEAIREKALLSFYQTVDYEDQLDHINLFSGFYREKYFDVLYETIAHEIAHGPGTDDADDNHAEGGLMNPALVGTKASFSAQTLKRFREIAKWKATLLL